MNEGTTNVRLPLQPDGGQVRAVMLFVDFSDRPASESTSTLYDRLIPHARAWYAEASYGRLRLEVNPVSRWIRMPQSLHSYGLTDGISWPEHHDYLADAVAAADPDVDFSPYQVVFVVAAKGTGVERSPAFQAYPGSGVNADGTELRYGATFFDDTRNNRFASNIVIHETGHILGLPDLYDIPNPVYWSLFRYTGGWDMMSWTEPGAHFLAWEKWKLGWLDPTQLTCLDGPGELTTTISPLERAGGLKAVVVPLTASSAYVVEARKRIGEDAHLCEDGVLVYSVDAGVRTGYGPVRMRVAQRDTDSNLRDRCGPLYNATYDRAKGEVATFTDGAAGVSVNVLSSGPAGYRVRVARTSLVTQSHADNPAPPPSTGALSEATLAPPQLSASGFPFGIAWDLGGPPEAD
jgi:M6 family metalloprotease-like protein